MRHRKTTKKLGREAGPRKALYRGLLTNLVTHGSIMTTEAKAKAIRPQIEKLVTKASKGTDHARREVAKVLYTKKAVEKLMTDIAPQYKERPGGYTRIVKLGFRQGDGAKMAQIEFV
jgi:large subunit ribosomal protein L17